MERQRAEHDEQQEEQVLQDERLRVQDRGVCAGRRRGGCRQAELLDACPCQVDVEEEEKDAEAEDRALVGGRVNWLFRWRAGKQGVEDREDRGRTSNFPSSRPRRLKRRCL